MLQFGASVVNYSSRNIHQPSPIDPAVFEALAGPAALRATGQLMAMLTRMVIAEVVAVAVAAWLASFIYNWTVLSRWPPAEQYISAALLIALLVLLVSLASRHFSALQTQPRHRFLWNGLGAVALAFSFFLSMLFVLKIAEWYSRGSFFFQFLAVCIAVVAVRGISHARLQAAIASGLVEARRAVLIGDPIYQGEVINRLKDAGILTVGLFPFPDYGDAAGEPLGATSENPRRMIETFRTLRPDDIVILATADDLPRTAHLADTLSELPVALHVVPAGVSDLLASSRLAELGSLLTIQVLHPPLSAVEQAIKRAFDIVAASVGLLVLSPLFLIVSIAVKLDSRGPSFFRQTRHGYNNETIRVFKFRSMTSLEDGNQFTQAVKDDPRVTRLGRLLRRTNIDELPQLLNVLSGEMSIVGPRPHPIALNAMFQQHISPFSRRHNVKPGITGWAQVNGYRGETDTLEKMQRRFEHDLYYIDNWSLMLDMKIILMTLFSKRAYANAC
jgi:Undecaprenyl-phosphate glucose phosphotransferase